HPGKEQWERPIGPVGPTTISRTAPHPQGRHQAIPGWLGVVQIGPGSGYPALQTAQLCRRITTDKPPEQPQQRSHSASREE
ncbi:hypothetical protein, partial [Klebsiella pneumoniae]|uniref:hypothetical protein n=1 Tax=Klebsiella pneumoniae TaxID=573 RepID=UPI003013446D